jgi:hypothetical protein
MKDKFLTLLITVLKHKLYIANALLFLFMILVISGVILN